MSKYWAIGCGAGFGLSLVFRDDLLKSLLTLALLLALGRILTVKGWIE